MIDKQNDSTRTKYNWIDATVTYDDIVHMPLKKYLILTRSMVEFNNCITMLKNIQGQDNNPELNEFMSYLDIFLKFHGQPDYWPDLIRVPFSGNSSIQGPPTFCCVLSDPCPLINNKNCVEETNWSDDFADSDCNRLASACHSRSNHNYRHTCHNRSDCPGFPKKTEK